MRIFPAVAIACLVVVIGGCSSNGGNPSNRRSAVRSDPEPPRDPEARALWERFARTRPLHSPLGEPGPSDWLANHKEDGQSFAKYVRVDTVKATDERRTIYVQPLGEFSAGQRRVLELTADYLGRCFQLPVIVCEDLPLSIVPDSARRQHPSWGTDQILTSFVLHGVLIPRLPDDAATYIAITASDLWPGPGWNFVYGEASTVHRVGVWSLYRNGDADAGEDEFRLCLLRTMKTAAHETGHMFTMQHCTLYECNMCGSNNADEADRHPLWLCPECAPKITWATGADPIKRYRELEEFCRAQGLTTEAEFFRRTFELIQDPKK
jgi:archaemetzincin